MYLPISSLYHRTLGNVTRQRKSFSVVSIYYIDVFHLQSAMVVNIEKTGVLYSLEFFPAVSFKVTHEYLNEAHSTLSRLTREVLSPIPSNVSRRQSGNKCCFFKTCERGISFSDEVDVHWRPCPRIIKSWGFMINNRPQGRRFISLPSLCRLWKASKFKRRKTCTHGLFISRARCDWEASISIASNIVELGRHSARVLSYLLRSWSSIP